MNILYCHDNTYKTKADGTIYSEGQFPYDYWSVFIEAFGHITVAARGEPLDEADNLNAYNVSNGPHTDFLLFPNINSLKGRALHCAQVNQALKKAVAASDGVIIRAVSDIGWLAFQHARALNKPVAMEVAACAWDSTWNHGTLLGKIYAPLRYRHDKMIARHADFAIYVSKEFLQSRYPTNGETVSVSNVRIREAAEAIAETRVEHIKSRQKYFSPCVIGLMGNLNNKIKGIHDAIQALSLVEEQRSGSFIFRHLGPGKRSVYEEQARKLGIADKIHFDGMLPTGHKVLEWLDAVDIYIQPSYQEGVPRAVIEAMSRACPVIGSTAGGIPELLHKNYMHRPGDVKGLAKLLIRMIDHPEDQIEQAYRNFHEASFYTHTILMPKRREFWKKFADFVEKKEGMKLAA